ncbi:MAG: ABC transporter substrate-binding protein [Roseiflexaceae bacterium]
MNNIIPPQRLRNPVLLVYLLAVALLLASCGTNIATPVASLPPANVKVQLSWIPTIEYAGFYIAEDKGYYAEQALTVNLLAGGEDAQGNYINSIDTVLHGQADFGVASGSNLLQARANKAPLVAVASIYQRHPLGFTSLAAKHIMQPRDLIGKTIQIAPDSVLLLQAMLTAQGIDPALVKTEERTDFTIAPLLSGKADVIDTFVTNELVTLKFQHQAVNNLLPFEYGIQEYPNVIFTTEKMIADHPDVVERFLRATLHGLQSAITDPQPVGALSIKHNSSLDLKSETEAMFQSVPLLNPSGSQPGMMTVAIWDATHQMLLDQNVLKQPLDVKAAYTLLFLDKIYAK